MESEPLTVEELRRILKHIDRTTSLLLDYITFIGRLESGTVPYLRMHIPSKIQKLYNLRGGDVVEVKLKVLKRGKTRR